MSASRFPRLYVSRFSGPAAEIVARDALWKDFQKDHSSMGFNGATQAMELYAEYGPESLMRTKFVSEMQFEGEGRKVRLEAFKGFQIRLYGFAVQVKGKRTFFITGLDLAKKANKAKPRVLEAAGKEAIQVLKALD